MTRRWTKLCLVLVLSLFTTTVSVAVTGAPAMADNGNGSGNSNGKKDKGNEKEKKENGRENEKGNGNDAVEPAAPYRVDVTCDPDEDALQTVCTFTGVAPEGAKDIGHVDLPAADVCATVLGGDAEYVDPDPSTGVVGYKSRGGGGVFTLNLAGKVTANGAAIYWVKAGNGVFPAIGPGLVCDSASPSGATVSAEVNVTGTLATPASADAASGGSVAVHTHACATDVDPATVDWFGACQPGVSGMRFVLSNADPTQPEALGDDVTERNGVIRFDALPPGTYRLDAPDSVWCHAESDNVNDRGELVVTPGAEVSVWIFVCGAETVA